MQTETNNAVHFLVFCFIFARNGTSKDEKGTVDNQPVIFDAAIVGWCDQETEPKFRNDRQLKKAGTYMDGFGYEAP